MDSINCVELAKGLASVGVSALAVHGRTRKQMYEGKADWQYIKAVKQAVSIPVMGNGDIRSSEDAKWMLDTTGCDAIMVGRGVLGCLLYTSQAFARAERYHFYHELLEKYHGDAILLAHHLDDHLETYLMQMERGSKGRCV